MDDQTTKKNTENRGKTEMDELHGATASGATDDVTDSGPLVLEMYPNPIDFTWMEDYRTYNEDFQKVPFKNPVTQEHRRQKRLDVRMVLPVEETTLKETDDEDNHSPQIFVSTSFVELQQPESSTVADIREPEPVSQVLETVFRYELEKYNMDNPQRGKALIFNEVKFDKRLGLGSRDGSDKDAREIKDTLKLYGFDLTVLHNCTWEEIDENLKAVANDDNSDADMFLCVYLSHGEEGGVYCRDKFFPTHSLWHYFSESNCPTLAGKPKIFIIQACRGTKVDDGLKTKKRSSTKDKTPSTKDKHRYSYSEGEKLPVEKSESFPNTTDKSKDQTKGSFSAVDTGSYSIDEIRSSGDFENKQNPIEEVDLTSRRHSEPVLEPIIVVTSAESTLQMVNEVDARRPKTGHDKNKKDLGSYYSHLEVPETGEAEDRTDSVVVESLITQEARDSCDSQLSSASEEHSIDRCSLPDVLSPINTSLLTSNTKARQRTNSEGPPRPRFRSKYDRLDAKTLSNEENIFLCNPVHEIPDTLVAYSTVQGYYSWRNPKDGSWFVQALCNVLRDSEGGSIFDLLHETNRVVAYTRQSNTPNMRKMHEKKQSCCLASTLTKELRLMKKAPTTAL